jgi:hypothetical protein
MAYAQEIIDFYCYRCRAYELKTSPHYRSQKRRLARRKATRATEAEQEQAAEQQQ